VQDREVAAVGSSVYEHVDTRVIAATNRNLKAMVDEGSFREDLYYRLNVFTITTPALRERPDDVMILAKHYLGFYAHQYGKGAMEFSIEAEQALRNHDWPGNVRELMNLINRAVIVSKENRVNNIHLGLFPEAEAPVTPTYAGDGDIAEQVQALVGLSLQRRPELPPIGQWLEDDIICSQLESNGGVLSQAAQNLRVPESTLRRKVNRIRETHGNTRVSWLKGWIDMPVMIDGLMRLSKDRNISVLDLTQNILVTEFERLKLSRQESARLLGVSLPTYRRYLS
jgi:two-component system response regulator FlrC